MLRSGKVGVKTMQFFLPPVRLFPTRTLLFDGLAKFPPDVATFQFVGSQSLKVPQLTCVTGSVPVISQVISKLTSPVLKTPAVLIDIAPSDILIHLLFARCSFDFLTRCISCFLCKYLLLC